MPDFPAPPHQREVAVGVTNLGNTCYMNAVLQALAHAPELCLALDYEPHHLNCPIAKGNAERREKFPDAISNEEIKKPTRKSRRSSKKTRSPATTTDSEESLDQEYCTLCEVEGHISKVHERKSNTAIAPENFVNGFIDHVAPPCFKLGVQEDSHEFLRLLIEAMQKSSTCVVASDESTSALSLHPSVCEHPPPPNLYPFKLFRGTVESTVCCASCEAKSSTVDPIEDIGIDVTRASGSLSDLSSGFQKFTKAEPLTGYKCESCGNVGSATKQSRLASIPPILTLHLKRFRYGSNGKPLLLPSRRGRETSQLLGTSGSAKIEGHIKFQEIFDLKPFLTESLKDKVKSMFCRLFAVIVHAGKNSHSGHYVAYVRNLSKNEWCKMDDARVSRATLQEVLNAEAYMLFYRVVEHPVAQELRAKQAAAVAARQREKEAQELEARFKDVHKKQVLIRALEEAQEKSLMDSEVEREAVNSLVLSPSELLEPTGKTYSEYFSCKNGKRKNCSDSKIVSRRKRKRETPEYCGGVEWAKAKTRLPPAFLSLIRRAEEFISQNVAFTPDYFKLITEEAAKNCGKGGPSNVCANDVQGGADRFRPVIIKLLHHLVSKVDGGVNSFLRINVTPKKKEDPNENTNKNKTLIVPVVEANETYL
eukprot:CAMPEP_0194154230 /NCGR_PEP_ID=MMETSP0152-20130528/59799_1 /TAXON_ID=1049557 /ORGANISM="Thalassiothrix antarctica, Strain L6-D1" /LENGTH=648 /DNA_ID=CAMNT_0038860163 /DNA_START=141 /DNA_END=2087 /DNA_ORIENTATION=-